MGFGSFCIKNENGKFITLQPKSISIRGQQQGFSLDLEIEQAIETEKDINEVAYAFQTDNKLCIYGMKFFIGEEILLAHLEEEKIAQETFQEAKKLGRTVVITQNTAPGITTITIGNVPKNKTVKVVLNCAFIATLMNPNTILAKIPLQGCEPDGNTIDFYELPTLDINFDLDIHTLENQSAKISSVSINCDFTEEVISEFFRKLSVKHAILMDENLLIQVEFINKVESQIIRAGKSAVISIIPEFECIQNYKKEFLFIVDCSASMNGAPIEKAKESLEELIIKLKHGESYFNIIRFGTTFQKLFPYSEKINEENQRKAIQFIKETKANLGGTEALELFQNIFNQDQQNILKLNQQKQIFFITDGEVYLREKVTKIIEENKGLIRIFAIGLGQGADAGFLDEITEVTNGKADFVYDVSCLPTKINEHFNLSLVNAASDVEVYIDGCDSFKISPFPLPPLLPNVVQHIYVTNPESDINTNSVMVSAKLLKNTEIETIIENQEHQLNWNEGNKPILALFAQQLLKSIEMIQNKEKSVKLSLESGVLCKFTSYVAVSNDVYISSSVNNAYISSSVKDVRVPASFECREFSRCSRVRKRMKNKECEKKKKSEHCHKHCHKHWKEADDFVLDDELSFSSSSLPSSSIQYMEIEESKPIEEGNTNKTWKNDATCIDIIRMQSKDGFWDLDIKFICEKTEGNVPEFDMIVGTFSPILKKRIISTIFTLAYLIKYESKEMPKWRTAKEKSLKWLGKIISADWVEITNEFQEKILIK